MPPRKKKPAARSVGLEAPDVGRGEPPAEIRALAEGIERDGGAVLCRYKDPFGGKWLILAALPVEKVDATPYQRELSLAHVERLAATIPKVGRFLDPVIAVRRDGKYWTPNGMHRLEALKALGAKAITALVLPEPEVAFRILALNVEKAHNLKDKSLEAIRMARGLAAAPEAARRPEKDWAFEFEEPSYLTLGVCYERKGRFSGGAYHPVLKRCEDFLDLGIREALEVRAERAAKILDLDAAVDEAVRKLRAAGFQSADLKPFVVARINPLRFARAARPGQKAPRADWDKTVEKMLAAARAFDVGKVRAADLAVMGGPPPVEEA